MIRATIAGLALATLVLGVAVVPTSAQSRSGDSSARMLRIGFGGGMTVPVSETSDALDRGLHGQGFLLVNLGGLPLRFNLGYQRFDVKEALSTAASGSTSILSGVAGVQFDLVQLGPLRPYVTAGLGAFRLSDNLDDGALVPDGADTNTTKFGIDGGAGLALRLGRLDGFIEARVQNVFTEAGLVDAKSIRSVPLTFGILF